MAPASIASSCSRASAAFLWLLLDGSRDRDELCRLVRERYEVLAKVDVGKDVDAFLAELDRVVGCFNREHRAERSRCAGRTGPARCGCTPARNASASPSPPASS